MQQEYGMEEVSLLEIMQAVKRGLWLIMCLTLIGAFGAAGVTLALEERVYQAVSTVVIGKESAKIFYEDKYTQSDIAMYEKIANTYVEIAKSDTVMEQIVEQFPEYTSGEIRKMVTCTSRGGTLLLEFKTIGSQRKDVMGITNTYAQVMMEICERVLPVGQLEVIDEARLPSGHMASKLPLNTLIGFMLGGVGAMLLILLRMFQEGNKVQTSAQVGQYLGLNVVTTIK